MGKDPASPPRRRCSVRVEGLRLQVQTPDGLELVEPRCKRRDCPRCWSIRSRELARALVLDARDDMPRHCLTLTTRTPWQELDPADVRRGFENVYARLRRRSSRCDYFAAIEFTTGRAASSGGHRRLHAHCLLKLGAELELELAELAELARDSWRKRTGAWRVELAELRSPGASLGYLGLHHRKPGQAPPAGWRGMAERHSRGYFRAGIAELRARARRELALEAVGWRRELDAHDAREILDSSPARLLRVRRAPGGGLLEPLLDRAGELDFIT